MQNKRTTYIFAANYETAKGLNWKSNQIASLPSQDNHDGETLNAKLEVVSNSYGLSLFLLLIFVRKLIVASRKLQFISFVFDLQKSKGGFKEGGHTTLVPWCGRHRSMRARISVTWNLLLFYFTLRRTELFFAKRKRDNYLGQHSRRLESGTFPFHRRTHFSYREESLSTSLSPSAQTKKTLGLSFQSCYQLSFLSLLSLETGETS